MPSADERLKPMQGLHGFATQTQINADKIKSKFKQSKCDSLFICVYLCSSVVKKGVDLLLPLSAFIGGSKKYQSIHKDHHALIRHRL
jgi:hypothetical protein